MRKNVSLKDIAEKAGCSVKTVSRALNNHPDVNENTRKRILKLAEEFSYYPNMVAKSLRTKKTFTIGYIVPDITNEFFGKVGIVIEKVFRGHGYSLLMSFTEESEVNEIKSLQLLLSKRVDGIILATVGTTGDFLREVIYKFHMPVVVIDNKEEGIVTNTVLHDNIAGAYDLTRHLIEHGHRDIACITGPLAETSGRDRLLGYRKALEEHGISVQDEYIKVSNWRVDGGYESTIELMKNSSSPPTAIFIANSIMALGAYKCFKKLSLSVPNDVALVSFDSLEFTEAIDPPLTTLSSVEEEVGKLAASLLMDKIRNGDIEVVSEHLIKAGLCIRKSCGCN